MIAPGSELAIAAALQGASSFSDLVAATGKRELEKRKLGQNQLAMAAATGKRELVRKLNRRTAWCVQRGRRLPQTTHLAGGPPVKRP
jgi:hypothetical protein